MTMKVYVLEHVHELDDVEDIKRVGVYESVDEATRARERSSLLPGFRDYPDGFHISEYELGRDHWTSGFVTIDGEGARVERSAGSQAA